VAEYDIQMYTLPSGKVPFESWLLGLRDPRARARIRVRIDRMQSGNFADHRSVGNGVYELRIDYGPGFRVYYALADKGMVLLLAGGDKSSQSADIATAIGYWKDYKTHRV